MIPATNAAALDAMLASPCRRHGKRAPGAPDADRLTSYAVLETAPKLSTARALGLWLTIRAQARMEGKEWVRVRTHLLEAIGLGTTWARSRAYAELERAGLIEVQRRKGYAPLVRLVPQRAGGGGESDG